MSTLALVVRLGLSVARSRARTRSQRGASSVEYGLLLMLVAMAIIGAVSFLGAEVSSVFSCSSEQIGDPSSTPC